MLSVVERDKIIIRCLLDLFVFCDIVLRLKGARYDDDDRRFLLRKINPSDQASAAEAGTIRSADRICSRSGTAKHCHQTIIHDRRDPCENKFGGCRGSSIFFEAVMIDLSSIKNYYIACGYTDLCRRIYGSVSRTTDRAQLRIALFSCRFDDTKVC